jgi:hypothetical protein
MQEQEEKQAQDLKEIAKLRALELMECSETYF